MDEVVFTEDVKFPPTLPESIVGTSNMIWEIYKSLLENVSKTPFPSDICQKLMNFDYPSSQFRIIQFVVYLLDIFLNLQI